MKTNFGNPTFADIRVDLTSLQLEISEFRQCFIRNNPAFIDLEEHINSEKFIKSCKKHNHNSMISLAIFPVHNRVSGFKCFDFLKNQGLTALGVYGLLLVQHDSPFDIPIRKSIVCFGTKGDSVITKEGTKVYYLTRLTKSHWELDFGFYDCDWNVHSYLLAQVTH